MKKYSAIENLLVYENSKVSKRCCLLIFYIDIKTLVQALLTLAKCVVLMNVIHLKNADIGRCFILQAGQVGREHLGGIALVRRGYVIMA